MSKFTISQVLKYLMHENDIRITELARKTGLQQPTVHRIVEGSCKKPHKSSLVPLARHFNISIEQLLGEKSIPGLVQQTLLKDKKVNLHKIPILEWDEIKHWKKIVSNVSDDRETIIYDRDIGPFSYAVSMNDTSMEPLFPKNSLLVIDPELSATHGSYALIYLKKQGKIVLRQHLISKKKSCIKSIHPESITFKPEPLTPDDSICGILVQVRYRPHSTLKM